MTAQLAGHGLLADAGVGRARFVAVEHRAVAEPLDARYPTYLTTGRLLQHYQSGAQTRRVAALAEAQPRVKRWCRPNSTPARDTSR